MELKNIRTAEEIRQDSVQRGIYSYLLLHRELLEDETYQKIANYCRKKLIASQKKRLKSKNTDEETIGRTIDLIASTCFNDERRKEIENYRPIVSLCYEMLTLNSKQ